MSHQSIMRNNSLFAAFGIDGGLRRCHSGNWNSERRATDVCQALLEAELHRSGIAALLATDTDFQRRADFTAFLRRHFNQHSDAIGINCLERVRSKHAIVQIGRDETTDIITRESEGHLRKVVGSE